MAWKIGRIAEPSSPETSGRFPSRCVLRAVSICSLVMGVPAASASVSSGARAGSKQKLSALKDAPASDFGAAYVSAQVRAYAAVGGLYQDFIKTGEAGEIRAFAEKLYPEMHMMETRVNSTSARNVVTDGED
ncbi:DUF4142 domain-containing protein [Shinella oryzae]|uniref:DUF4142 domain-containing protein n=1 Tax=Shinella oryzae TaxID=2871820 RepID=UPI001FF3D020|nr:DUF4142 domain-containing protein [Shinella oryzae]UPA27758.1 DUF4142 domain-containing protein [Shinella oryzae]